MSDELFLAYIKNMCVDILISKYAYANKYAHTYTCAHVYTEVCKGDDNAPYQIAVVRCGLGYLFYLFVFIHIYS